jgi:aryl-alcohol dehydrogenase-like predicted oxidoreductase
VRYRTLGETGIEVSELCLGVLTVGPLQEDLSPGEGGRVIRHALERGITFLDTAEAYGTYPHIRAALRGCPVRPVVATKSYAHTGEDMRRSLERARREMDLDVIDLFLLHEQESEATLRGHQQALEFLVEARERGLVRAVGISTHSVRGAVAGALHPLVQVIHPLLNLAGLGIMDGSREQMQAAIDRKSVV